LDTVELDLMRRDAGAAYLKSLEALGLRPDALFWAFDKIEQRFVLILATEMFDFKGPLPIADLLFRAYNACATPKEIDPFVVRLHSPEHAVIRQYEAWNKPDIAVTNKDGLPLTNEDGSPLQKPVLVHGVVLGEVEFRHAWVYRFQLPPKRKSGDLVRRWRNLESSVDRLAA
jgi:hypothetical protein